MFTLPLLPYIMSALEPHMSARTLEFHYGKHHQTYIDNLNKLVAGMDLEKISLKEIILKTANDSGQVAIFNNAAQSFNHEFFWQCLKPADTKMEVASDLLELINKSFGSLDSFQTEFKTAALGQFGSGWVWLIQDKDGLKIMKTANADNPIAKGLKPLFALDVWEHSYYLDYQNRRGDFVEAVMKNLVNWDFIRKNLA